MSQTWPATAAAIALLSGAAAACQTVDKKTKAAAAATLAPPAKKTAAPAKKATKSKKTVAKDKPALPAGPVIQAPALPEKLEPETEGEKKLDGTLLQVVRASRLGGVDAAGAKAKSLNILDGENLMKVEITATGKDKVDAIKQVIQAQKGNVLVSLENHIFAMVPTASLEELAKSADVFAVAVVSETVRQ